ncbi:MAG: hypothetical protein ACKO9Z_13500 [Planctomycetota bacterium]
MFHENIPDQFFENVNHAKKQEKKTPEFTASHAFSLKQASIWQTAKNDHIPEQIGAPSGAEGKASGAH